MTLKQLLAVTFVVLCFASSQARASTLVPGSTFDLTLVTYDYTTSGLTQSVTTTVPANGATVFSYGSVSVTASESESTLATGQQQVTISLISTGDMFSDTSTDVLGGLIGIGIFGNPLQFSSPFDLGSAILTFSGVHGVFASNQTVGDVANPNPFDGVYLRTDGVAGYEGVQNLGIDNIQLQLTSALAPMAPLEPTPEPSSLVLLATGLLGVGGAVKRRFA